MVAALIGTDVFAIDGFRASRESREWASQWTGTVSVVGRRALTAVIASALLDHDQIVIGGAGEDGRVALVVEVATLVCADVLTVCSSRSNSELAGVRDDEIGDLRSFDVLRR
jgi:hypothetical protein